MDDVHSFHEHSYEKADDLEEPGLARRIYLILTLVPGLIVKTLIIVVLQLYYLLLGGFHLIVPRTLKDIRGQLAVVGLIQIKQLNFNDVDIQYEFCLHHV